MWEYCGMSRNAAGLQHALSKIPELREQFWHDVKVLGTGEELNQELERAGRVADFFELAELMCLDALDRDESCGGHLREEHQTPDGEALLLREEHQTPDGEALRDDEHFSFVSAWEWKGVGQAPALHKEPLAFEYVKPSQRSYK